MDGERRFGDGFGDARAGGGAEGQGPAAGFEQERVGVAVIAADAFDDQGAAGGGAGEADGAHGRFGAAVDEADHVDGWQGFDDFRGQRDFALGGSAVAGAAADGFGEGGDDPFVGVAGDDGAVAGDVIDVVVAVDVGDDAPLGQLDEQRGAADGFEGADGRADAAGHELAGLEEVGFGRRDGTGFLLGHRGKMIRERMVRGMRGDGLVNSCAFASYIAAGVA